MSILFLIAALTLAVLPFALYGLRPRAGVWLCPIFLAGFAAAATFWGRPRNDAQLAQLRPREAAGEKGFVSSDACRSCHPGQYASWHDSYHRTMTQIASPDAVVAPFEGVRLQASGVSFQLERLGDEYWIEAHDPFASFAAPGRVGGGRGSARHQVVMTTGSHHMQGYWVNSGRGREVRLFPWMYHIRSARWLPFQHTFLVDPDFEFPVDVRFDQISLRWNDTCIACHSVDGRPRLEGGQTRDSEVAELGIACEACHGPGAEHIRRHRSPLGRWRQRRDGRPDPSIVNPARLPHDVSAQVCGQCHSIFEHDPPPDEYWSSGPVYRAGGDLLATCRLVRFQDQLDPAHPFHGSYWSDGTIRIGGREYQGLIESPCYQRGAMSCLSCHSMHRSDPDDQLQARMDGNQACLQCHQDLALDISAHTHHAAGSSGSLCYSCHMPYTTYALFKAIRSHRIDSPHTTGNLQSDRPNACNLCHLDRTLQWTADHLAEWYDMPPVTFTGDEQSVAASLLWLLRGDAAQRVTTAWNMGQEPGRKASGRDWQPPFLAPLLEDPYSAVRFVAYDALRRQDGFEDFEYDFIGPLRARQRARQQVVALWQRHTTAEPRPQLLMSQTGALRQDRIQDLLQRRDDRPITLPE